MAPLTEADAVGVQRDATGLLVPTSKTSALLKFEYTISKGSVSDRLFHFDTMDSAPPSISVKPATEVAAIGEEGIYEVEVLRSSRKRRKRTEYLVKWRD